MTATSARLDGNLRGSIWMAGAMFGFSVEDMLLKSVAKSLPVGQILMVFGALGMLGFAALTVRRGERVFHPAILSRVIAVKSVFEVMGRLFFTLSLALTSLSATSAILQATPLVVVAGAALIFGEKVGWRRWLAIVIGFIGVLVILQPGMDGFSPLSMLAVLGMIGFAGRDLATRAAPPVLSNVQLGIYGFAMMVPTGAGLLLWTGGAAVPSALDALRLVLASGVGVAAYYALTQAMRMGDVAVITPFRYTRLVFALILGALVFGERPEAHTLIGSAIIVAAGIYTLLRARKKTV